MKEIEVLMEALQSGSIIKVVYKSGSQPGYAREILPLSIYGNELFAKCILSDAKKSFFINKLKLLTDEKYSKLPKWNPDFSSLTDYEIFQLRKHKRSKMALLCTFIIGVSAIFLTFIFLR